MRDGVFALWLVALFLGGLLATHFLAEVLALDGEVASGTLASSRLSPDVAFKHEGKVPLPVRGSSE